jgi:sugar phosphate isomerase/epimerase
MLYLSTGGFSSQTFSEVALNLDSDIVKGLELSSGKYTNELFDELKKVNQSFSLALHNYFPVPKEPFVFNLASLDENIVRKSFEHAERAISLSASVGCPYYSFHAGYLLDPNITELGHKIKEKKVIPRDDGLKQFVSNVNKLSKYASERNVRLLIENNVLSQENYNEFKSNPLLMVDGDEAELIFDQLDDNVSLLIDVAHLKVSSRTLNFCPYDYLKKFWSITGGYHFSDNDGTEDSNDAFDQNAWFWDYIRKDLDYYSIEVYRKTFSELQNQYQLTLKCLEI